MNTKRINELLDELAEIGKEAFVPEAQNKMTRWAKIGMALTRVTDSVDGVVELAYEFLQDWNYHGVCAVLDWMIPPRSLKFWDSDLDYLKKMINKNDVEIVFWNYDNSEILTKHARVRVNIEWLE